MCVRARRRERERERGGGGGERERERGGQGETEKEIGREGREENCDFNTNSLHFRCELGLIHTSPCLP